jgi:hypothetical protein
VVNFTEITEKADPARVMTVLRDTLPAMSHELMIHPPAPSTKSSATAITGDLEPRRPTIRITAANACTRGARASTRQ